MIAPDKDLDPVLQEQGRAKLRAYIDGIDGKTVGRKFTTEEMIENTCNYLRETGSTEEEIASFVYNQRLKK